MGDNLLKKSEQIFKRDITERFDELRQQARIGATIYRSRKEESANKLAEEEVEISGILNQTENETEVEKKEEITSAFIDEIINADNGTVKEAAL